MASLPSIFDLCKPRREVLAGELPDAIFAADLWDVISGQAHEDYRDPIRFFTGTHPTENLKLLMKEVAERLAGIEGGTPVFLLETGFGGGKTHSLIATVHVAREGNQLASFLADYRINKFPVRGDVRVAAFVGEESDPLGGNEHVIEGKRVRTYTPWGQIALFSGGVKGYELIRENDIQGVAPEGRTFETALGDHPVLVLIDELVLYMARAFALPEDHPRSKVNSQWATFLQTLFKIAARRPKTVVILTLPSEQDANRKLTGELKQFISAALETMDELEQTAARQARNLTPTQSYERAAVLARRLFDAVDTSHAADVARAYMTYYETQRDAGVQIDSRAFAPDFAEQIRVGYPFHPELIRLFAERLADIPEFQATRGALRLVARTVRGVWENKRALKGTLLLQPYHVDLSRSDIRDEILARLGRTAFERGLEADVARPEGGTHANAAETGWPWHAATEAALVAFLHSLPDASRGVTPAEVALAIGRPGCDLAYVARGLEETERRAWYMRREGEHYLFRTRASINKRFQERLSEIQQQPGEVRETLDAWIQEIYSGFSALQVIPFPQDHTAIPNTPEKVRLVIVHYDKECGAVGGGDRLNFTKTLFTKTGVNENPRSYRNNLVFLLAESVRVANLKDAVRALIAWERVRKDIEIEQTTLAQASGSDFRTLKDLAKRGATGVPAEFLALENDLGEVLENSAHKR
jgi:predicted AAA+ superfamily ATPase